MDFVVTVPGLNEAIELLGYLFAISVALFCGTWTVVSFQRRTPDFAPLADALRYYVDGRTGRLPPIEVEEEIPEPVIPADVPFKAWFDAVEWSSPEEAEDVEGMWQIVTGRRKVSPRERVQARMRLSGYGCPLPTGADV